MSNKNVDVMVEGELSDEEKRRCWLEILDSCFNRIERQRDFIESDLSRCLYDAFWVCDLTKFPKTLKSAPKLCSGDVCVLKSAPSLVEVSPNVVLTVPSSTDQLIMNLINKVNEDPTSYEYTPADVKTLFGNLQCFTEVSIPSNFINNNKFISLITDINLSKISSIISELDLIYVYGSTIYTLNSIILISSAVLLSIIILTALIISRSFKNF
jgi:hypothetical protein